MAEIVTAEDRIKKAKLLKKKLTNLLQTGVVIRQVGGKRKLAVKDLDVSKSFINRLSSFRRSFNTIYSDIMAQQANRAGRMFEYDLMEQTPEIAAALDLYADEAFTKDSEGVALIVESDNERIREILENLFYDILNVNMHLWPAIRASAKYGDFFWLLNLDEIYGVVGFQSIDPEFIERQEEFETGKVAGVKQKIYFTVAGFGQGAYHTPNVNPDSDNILQNWEIAHFRLVSDSKFLPYGRSMLEPIRKLWKQLVLLEDAMLVYRVTRAPERRIFKIDVGNLPPEDVERYIEQVKQKIKKAPIVDATTGQIDLRFNVMPIHKDSIIPLLDSRNITIEQLAKEYREGKENYIYSIQDKTHQIVPGKVIWCGKNYTTNKIAKVTLDDNSVIKTACEHPFILRDGSKKAAKDLKSNDSLMPFYKKYKTLGRSKKEKSKYTYESTYNPQFDEFEFTHRLMYENRNDHRVIHHKNFKRYDNRPCNLDNSMTSKEHWMFHSKNASQTIVKWVKSDEGRANARKQALKINSTEKHRKMVSEANKKYKKAQYMNEVYNGSELHKEHNKIRSRIKKQKWKENHELYSKQLRYKLDQRCNEKIYKIFELSRNSKISTRKIAKILKNNEEFMNYFYSIQTNGRRTISEKLLSLIIAKYYNASSSLYNNSFKQFLIDKNNLKNFKEDFERLNHRVKRIEIIDEEVDVYCITIMGLNGENDRHNFAVCTQDNVLSGCFLRNSIDEDFFIPVRGDRSTTTIDTLPSGQRLGDIDDILYMQKKMFTGLKIPMAFLSQEQDLNAKSTLAMEDVRFARTINRIQDAIISELSKIAIIHLFILGFEDEDLINFDLRLVNPSTLAEQMKLDLTKARLDVAQQASESNLYDRDKIMEEILGFSDDEIEDVNKKLVKDKKYMANILKIEQQTAMGEEEGETSPTEESSETVATGERDLGNIERPFSIEKPMPHPYKESKRAGFQKLVEQIERVYKDKLNL